MKVVPIAISAALVVLGVWRWPRLGWPLRIAGLVLCVGLALYGAEVFRLPQLETTIGSVGSTLGPYTYVLVGVMAFLETGAFVGLLVPGETVVVVGGVIAGQGHVDIVALIALTWSCSLAGDLTGYVLGRRLGRRFLLEHGPKVGVTEPRLLRVEEFFARYGPAAILIGRFVGLVRPVAPFLAGASRYPRGRFVVLAVIGTGLWSATFVLLGFFFWQSFDQAIAIAKRGSLALGGTVVLVIGLVWAYRYLRRRMRRSSKPPRPIRGSADAGPTAARGDRPGEHEAHNARPVSRRPSAAAPSEGSE